MEKQFLRYHILIEDSGDDRENERRFWIECGRIQEACFKNGRCKIESGKVTVKEVVVESSLVLPSLPLTSQ